MAYLNYLYGPSKQGNPRSRILVKFLQKNIKLLYMANITNPQPAIKTPTKAVKIETSYRGFSSIDQEIEREIAMQWFTSSSKTTFSQRNFLLKKDKV